MVMCQDFIVNRADLSDTAMVESERELPDGSVLLKISQFALTTNNITYAVADERLGYWHFFPTNRAGWGQVPVWGFADIVESRCENVKAGARVYGYLPMSSHLVVMPAKVTSYGFHDSAMHRADKSPIYNQYSFVSADVGYSPDLEPLIALFKPLFTTSFLLDDMLRRETCFGAEKILITSASSKTAIGLAHLLSNTRIAGVETIGLTSRGNVDFVRRLGLYDTVVAYDALEDVPTQTSVMVDMAGNTRLTAALWARLGNNLLFCSRVGITHFDKEAGYRTDSGPKSAFFFAPSYAQERLNDWGGKEFQARLGKAWEGFLHCVSDWTTVERATGVEAVKSRYLQMLRGEVDPKKGHMLSF